MGTVELTCGEGVSSVLTSDFFQEGMAYWIGDDEDVCVGGVVSDSLGEIADN